MFLNKLVGMVEPVPEAAEMLGVSKTRVHQLIKSGHLKAVQIGKQFFVDSLSLQERIDSRGVHVASGPALNSEVRSPA